MNHDLYFDLNLKEEESWLILIAPRTNGDDGEK